MDLGIAELAIVAITVLVLAAVVAVIVGVVRFVARSR
jgi:hypothetical protein